MASAGFMFVTVDGTSVPGESSVSSHEREDSIPIVELNHDVTSPYESSTGNTTGIREHRMMRVSARVDKAVPLMYRAWAENQDCAVELRFWRPSVSGSGVETEFFKISMSGVRVARIKMHWPNTLHREPASTGEQVEYGFTYQDIIWEMVGLGIEYTDRWYAQPGG